MLSRIHLPAIGAVFLPIVVFFLTLPLSHAKGEQDSTRAKKTPVIFDTDIGDDIDDTWALALLLRCPELDVKLIATEMGKGHYRAKLTAKLLEIAGRTDIPIAIGHGPFEGTGGQQQWVEQFDLDSYAGTVHDDGVRAMIDVIMQSNQPVTVIAVGPVPSLAEAMRREPSIASRACFVGMHGSVRKGYGGSDKVAAEYNVKADASACQTVFTSPWEMTITPLDTCGIVNLTGGNFARVRDSDDPLLEALVENYYIWAENTEWFADRRSQMRERSSTLFDTVAVYLAITDQLCNIETLPIRVTDEGMTIVDPAARKMHVATNWKDLGAFEDWLVERLTGTNKE